jgi:hypothetical protein
MNNNDVVDISDLDQIEVFMALYNNSFAQGMGILHYDPAPMTRAQAEVYFEAGYSFTDYLPPIHGADRGVASFDYVKGRVMKLLFDGSGKLNVWGYNRDVGEGAAQRVIENLRNPA